MSVLFADHIAVFRDVLELDAILDYDVVFRTLVQSPHHRGPVL